MLDRAELQLCAILGIGILVFLVPIALVIASALRQERHVQGRVDRAMQRGMPLRGVIATCHGMQGQAWVFDVQVPSPTGPLRYRVEQLLPKWVAAALSPGREALVRLDPDSPGYAAFDLAAMGWSLPG